MSRISNVFKPGHKALIGYITAGYPALEATPSIVRLMAECGCDIIELGIPFSDPLGDGPTIQKASQQALQNGVTLQYCFETAGALRKTIDAPIVFMSYFNPIFNFGLPEFCRRCQEAGIDGLIVPDAPPEESLQLESYANENEIDTIYLLAPTSTEERMITITSRSKGFVYIVSTTGVTGARDTLPAYLETFVRKVQTMTSKPLCIGFGISTAAQARHIASFADGIIVGSQIIHTIDEDPSLASTRNLLMALRNAINY